MLYPSLYNLPAQGQVPHTGEWVEFYLIKPRKGDLAPFPLNELDAIRAGFKTRPSGVFLPIFYMHWKIWKKKRFEIRNMVNVNNARDVISRTMTRECITWRIKRRFNKKI